MHHCNILHLNTINNVIDPDVSESSDEEKIVGDENGQILCMNHTVYTIITYHDIHIIRMCMSM